MLLVGRRNFLAVRFIFQFFVLVFTEGTYFTESQGELEFDSNLTESQGKSDVDSVPGSRTKS